MFEWVITERVNEDQWKEIDRAKEGYKTYKTAMASGLMALEEMIADLDVGPRRDAEQTDRPHIPPEERVPATSDGQDAASPKGPRNAAYFGFGPIR